jgi:beta-ureidopropionase
MQSSSIPSGISDAPRIVRTAVIQTRAAMNRDEMVNKQLAFIETAAEEGVQVACLQELCTTPYFCQVQDEIWFQAAERIPDSTTIRSMQASAKRHQMVLVIPMFETEGPGLYYNTAAVIDADGTYLGKYRKVHIPQNLGFYEKFYFRPGNVGYPVFATRYAKVGVYICYDRHFPEGARALGLGGAELVFMPAATGAKARDLWSIEQRSHAAANGYFVGTVNRVGKEPLGDTEFFGHSYFADPKGCMVAEGSGDEGVITSDIDLNLVRVARGIHTFLRDRRPETYAAIVEP